MQVLPRVSRRVRLGGAAAAAAAGLAVSTGAPAQAATLPEGGLAETGYRFVFEPGVTRGANDWTCKPSAEHPNPVILVPGTFANHGASFVKIAPRLKNAGYCVYTLNYGQTSLSLNGRIGGLGHVQQSAENDFAPFLAKVKASTGAAKVDVIGHSQGGSVPMWYIKKMGGANDIAHYVGWAPSSRGTTLNGIVTLGDTFAAMGWISNVAELAGAPGATDQAYTSDYTQALFPNGSNDVPAGPKYTVISTKQDRVVTPYYTQRLSGQNVTNITLQDKCGWDQTGHAFLFLDDPTLQMTMNALADGPTNFQPTCTGFAPIPFA